MTVTFEQQRELAEATGRFTMYSLLATGFAFPTHDQLDLLRSRLLPAARSLALPGELGGALDEVAAALPADISEARRRHADLFPPIASQDAPGYETGYRGEGIFQQSALMADVAGFYRAHGLRAGGRIRERVDHITVELEFMAFVAKKEALAIQEGDREHSEVCRDTSELFLRDHIGCWAPAFGRRANAVASSRWLRSLGALLTLWIDDEMTAMGVSPSEVAEEPVPVEPPDDGSCGPCPVGGAS